MIFVFSLVSLWIVGFFGITSVVSTAPTPVMIVAALLLSLLAMEAVYRPGFRLVIRAPTVAAVPLSDVLAPDFLAQRTQELRTRLELAQQAIGDDAESNRRAALLSVRVASAWLAQVPVDHRRDVRR